MTMRLVVSEAAPCDGAVRQPATGEWLVPDGATTSAALATRPRGYVVRQVPAGMTGLEVDAGGRVVPATAVAEPVEEPVDEPVEGEVTRVR